MIIKILPRSMSLSSVKFGDVTLTASLSLVIFTPFGNTNISLTCFVSKWQINSESFNKFLFSSLIFCASYNKARFLSRYTVFLLKFMVLRSTFPHLPKMVPRTPVCVL